VGFFLTTHKLSVLLFIYNVLYIFHEMNLLTLFDAMNESKLKEIM